MTHRLGVAVYSSKSSASFISDQVVAQLVGHTHANVTINVYTQLLDASLRTAVDCIGGQLFTIVLRSEMGLELTRIEWLAALDDFRNWLVREAA